MNRKLLIASILCILGVLALAAISSSPRFPFYGAGLLLEAAFLLFVTWLFWLAPTKVVKRIALLVLSFVVMATISTYLDSLVFGKVDFHPVFILQALLGHLVITTLFLVAVFVVDRGLTMAQTHRQRGDR